MVKEEKERQVEELVKLIKSYSTLALLDLYKLMAKPLQEFRRTLKGVATIKVAKKAIILHAIRKVFGEKAEELEKYLPQQPAIILTNVDPFKFYLTVSEKKVPLFAKAGDVATGDILIPAGITTLSPGPVISEFGKLKIPVGIEKGKIAIKKDVVVARKGDVITKELASILRKLEIEPIEAKLNIVAIYRDGKIYTKDVLSLVGERMLNMIKDAFVNAINLTVNISYPTKENVKYLFSKAYQIAKGLENKLGV